MRSMTTNGRSLLALGLTLALITGCAAGSTSTAAPTSAPTDAPVVTLAPTPLATPASTPAPTREPTDEPTPEPTVAATPAASPTPVAWPAGITAFAAETAGNNLGYLEYLPPNYEGANRAAPLLVYLHGAGGGGAGREPELLRLLREGAIPDMLADGTWPAEQPFVVLVPQ